MVPDENACPAPPSLGQVSESPSKTPESSPARAIWTSKNDTLPSTPGSSTYGSGTQFSIPIPDESPEIIKIGELYVRQPNPDNGPPPRGTTSGYRTICCALTVACLMMLLTSSITRTIMYCITSGEMIYMINLLVAPPGTIFASFAAMVIIFNVMVYCVGPIGNLTVNSQTYSVLRTPVPRDEPLPPVVVMMPVYKEDLEEVIVPTYHSVQRAMDHYTSKGGTCWWLICDDGYTLIDRKSLKDRVNFYIEHSISFVGRPAAGRRGLFKKASNMNFTLRLSDLMKERMAKDEGLEAVDACLQVWEEREKDFYCGGMEGVLIPDDAIILLIDADTRVPPTCIYDTIGEFMVDKELAYTQHYTTPFEDQCSNYYECMVSTFTRKIYFCGFVVPCSLGALAPLVGHNAFLRLSSMKKAGFECPEDKFLKYWSEDTVSEDYDLFMRLAQQGMFGRLVAYTGEEFREGVSLTYIDEVMKFQKFAYGTCEMVFNRFKDWPRRGPITPMFRRFLRAQGIRWPEKFAMIAYLSTYLAMGTAFYFACMESVASIVMPGLYDHFSIRSFDVTITCIFVFAIIGTFLSEVVLMLRVRHVSESRQHKEPALKVMATEIWYGTFMTFFFSSLSFHLTTACFCYFFNIRQSWGSTVKERSGMSAWEALKITLETFWKMYLTMGVLMALYLMASWYYQVGLYRGWGIMYFGAAHMVGPILLNPSIITVDYKMFKLSK